MRVLLIYPPISKFERYSSSLGSSGGQQIPLGIFYLASVLREAGHHVEVVDGEARKMSSEDINSYLVSTFPCDLVGISSTTVAFHRAVETAELIKRSHPHIPIVLGGPHVSSNTEHAMNHLCFDYGVVGEGEHTLTELVSAIEEGTDLTTIRGLVFRKSNALIKNSPRKPIHDLDSLPFPAYDLIPDISVYAPPPTNYMALPVVNIITSRGCPNQCTFCDQSIFGRTLRQRSAVNVAKEIQLLYEQHNVREIAFVDDTFTLRPKRMREIFAILDEKHIHLPWTCMSRLDTVDFDDLKFMKAGGCWHISFGIESGDENILNIIKKKISLDACRRVIGYCKKLGIRTKGFFIVGHPGETIESIEKTIKFALELPLDDVVVTINTPIPGTVQFAEADHYGYLDTTDWSKYNYWRPVFVPKGLDESILISKHKEFYRRFYFRPRIIWRYATSFLSKSGPRRFLSLFRSLPYLFEKK
jgi:radical SAM superfamily enzyme YgiQ (UPF0313 family)